MQSKRGYRRLYFKGMHYNLCKENDKFSVGRTFFLSLTPSFCLRLFFLSFLKIYSSPFRTVFSGVHFGSALLSDVSKDVKELKTNWLYFSNANKTHKYQKHSMAHSLLNWMFWILFQVKKVIIFARVAGIFHSMFAYFSHVHRILYH